MTQPSSLAWALRATATVILISVLAGCAMFGRSDPDKDRLVQPGAPRTSPSGRFVASAQDGPVDDGVKTLVVVITDRAGAEVFRDTDAYSTRHGVGVTWLSTKDQLWILSSDVGTSYVELRDGRWVKNAITPQTRDQIPEEIAKLQ